MSVEIVKAIADGREPAALVTVVAVQGSAPRHAGAKMLVLGAAERHPFLGTVGGGKGEAAAIAAALDSLRDRKARLLTLEFQGTEVEGQDMICGGTSRLLVEPILDRRPYRAAMERLARGERVRLAKTVATDGSVAIAVQDEQGADPREAVPPPGQNVFVDHLVPREKLLILGGGYVGQAVAWHGARLDFTVSVGDDRPEFSAAGRFPPGTRTWGGTYSSIVDGFPFDLSTYVVMVTRGHLTDLECARAVLKRRYRYAGFIGSSRKATLLKEQLAADGVDPRKVEGLHAPIGLDVGAETPDELAIAILAEIVAVRRNADAGPAGRAATQK